MEARLRVAFINLIFTIYTLVAWFTLNQLQEDRWAPGTRNPENQTWQKCIKCTYYALICALIVFACCSIATRVWFALVNHLFAVTSCISRLALTFVGIAHIYTMAGILTHIFLFQTYNNFSYERTYLLRNMKIISSSSWETEKYNKKWNSLTFSSSKVPAGHVGDIAIWSSPSHCTMAGPGSGPCVRAGATIVAANLTAQVHIILQTKRKIKLKLSFRLKKTAITYWHTLYLTVLSNVSCWASAAVGAQAVRAGASIFTGLRVTLILLVFTELPMKSRTATARECVDVIDASPVIQTGAKERAHNF